MASSACVGGSLRIDGAEYLAVISDDRNALYVQGSAGETIGVIQGSCVDQPLRFFKQQTLGSAESYTSTGPSGAYCWLAYETKLELVWVGVSPQEPRLLSETMIIYGSMKAAGIVSSIHLLDSRQGSQALLAVVSKNVSSRSYVATVIETSSTLISAEKVRYAQRIVIVITYVLPLLHLHAYSLIITYGIAKVSGSFSIDSGTPTSLAMYANMKKWVSLCVLVHFSYFSAIFAHDKRHSIEYIYA